MHPFSLPCCAAALLLVLVSLPHCQTKYVTISESMFDSAHTDIDTLVNLRGKLIQSECDTLFLINRKGVDYLFYCNTILGDVKLLSIPLISIRDSIRGVRENIDSVKSNVTCLTQFIDTYEKDLRMTITQLENNNHALDTLNAALQNDLQAARIQLAQQKWRTMLRMVLWGCGGVVVGAAAVAVIGGVK
jgi:hypothetical protein